MSHARLAPSKAKVWIPCPASVRRQEGLPDEPSDAAIWGTVCHAVLERALLNQVHPLDVPVQGIPDIGLFGIYDVQEMRDTAAVAYEYVLFQGTILAESKSYPGQLIGRDDCWGTADITVLNPGRIEIADLKTGKGVICEPDDPQLKLYGVGKLMEHYPDILDIDLSEDLSPGRVPDVEVVLTIIQPRANHQQGPIRSLVYSGIDLIRWGRTEFYAAAIASDRDDSVGVPGPHCKKGFCKAQGTCPELAAAGMAAAQAVFMPLVQKPMVGITQFETPAAPDVGRQGLADALVREPDQLTLEQVRYILDHESLITGWLNAVRTYAREQAGKGVRVPGYKLVQGRSNRSWSLKDEALFSALQQFTKQDGAALAKADLVTESPISPAQAEKQVKPLVAPATWAQIQGFIIKGPGAPSLVPETDSRPALLINASDVFTPIEQDDLPDYLK